MSSDGVKAKALARYIAMPERSLTGLAKELAILAQREGFDPPALRSLQRWSSDDRWQDRARRHDLEVQERLQEAVTGEAVAEALNAAAELRAFAMDGLAVLKERLKDVNIETAEGLKTLTGIVIDALAAARIEEGGVSDRREDVKTEADMRAYGDELRERFKHLGPRPASPTPTPATTTRPVETAPEPEAEHTPSELVPEGDDDEPTPSVRH